MTIAHTVEEVLAEKCDRRKVLIALWLLWSSQSLCLRMQKFLVKEGAKRAERHWLCC